jgi:hypothetical protein
MDVSGKRARGWNRVARLRRSLILCVAIVAVPTATVAQSRLNDPGIGGTGDQPGEGNGIGGTGQPFNRNPGIGGTGIIGTITGFGSILVNGYEVDYAPEQPIKWLQSTQKAMVNTSKRAPLRSSTRWPAASTRSIVRRALSWC